MVGGSDDAFLGGAGGGENVGAVLLQFVDDALYVFADSGVGLNVAMDDEDRRFKAFIHC